MDMQPTRHSHPAPGMHVAHTHASPTDLSLAFARRRRTRGARSMDTRQRRSA